MGRVLPSRRWSPDALKLDLVQIRNEQPDALVCYPGEGEIQHPPVSIWLAAWAVDVAEALHRRYGQAVGLVVGNMQFPDRRLQGRQSLLTGWHFYEGATPMEPADMTVTAENSLVVESGHVLRNHLIARNPDDKALRLSFDGPPEFTGILIDPTSGSHVNGNSRAFDRRQSVIDICASGRSADCHPRRHRLM